MRTSITLAALIAGSALISGCNRHENLGPMVSRGFQVGTFNQVEAAGPFDLTIHTGAAPSVQARGNQSLIDNLQVDVENGTLRIRPRSQHSFFNFSIQRGRADIAITVPTLTGATLAGAGDVNIDKVQGDSFEGKMAGAGDLTIQSAQVKALKLSVAGSGSADVKSGNAQSGDYGIAGAGDVDTSNMTSQDVKISIAGSGDIKAHATGTADVSIMGSGDVTVTGGAKCSVSKAGSGDVHCS
ncbi:MAG TPA: head GIN domain-containing protein [Sphingomicrobium sp.]|nr:head GIN domain-containing protein [Sphingomicrobium sp.]